MPDPLDFTGKRVLVVGGTSGIGNGIARAFLERGAEVHVTGTRASAEDYAGEEGCDLTGLAFHRLDVADRDAVAALDWPDQLDAAVLCQGTVRYGREEFEQPGWDDVIAINLSSLMDCARALHPALAAARGSLIVVSSVGAIFTASGRVPSTQATVICFFGSVTFYSQFGEIAAPRPVCPPGRHGAR